MSKECPTCHRPFERKGKICQSCHKPIKKGHRWHIAGSVVRHDDCGNPTLAELCTDEMGSQRCILAVKDHPQQHVSQTGTTWTVYPISMAMQGPTAEDLEMVRQLGVGWADLPLGKAPETE